jgi:hypothetical protein
MTVDIEHSKKVQNSEHAAAIRDRAQAALLLIQAGYDPDRVALAVGLHDLLSPAIQEMHRVADARHKET